MILVKEEFVGGEKWCRAVKLGASDAVVMWLAMKNYCSQHPDTEGFVPDEDLDGLPGAPRRARKALEALIACGRRLPGGERGPGLAEAVEGGWRLHDYLDHSASPEETQLRREKARLKKEAYRESKRRELAAVRRLAGELAGAGDIAAAPGDNPGDNSGGHSGGQPGDSRGDTPGDSPVDVPRDALAGASASPSARAPARVGARAHPNPSQPNPTKKSLPTLANGIRDARARATALQPCAEHRRFAADHGLDLEHFLAEIELDPLAAALPAAEALALLAGRLMTAATEQQRIGGAA